MPAMLIHLKVADYHAWRPVFDDHGLARRANGSQGGRIYRSANEPDDVIILLEWDELERARLFADSDELRESMAQASVVELLDILLLESEDPIPR